MARLRSGLSGLALGASTVLLATCDALSPAAKTVTLSYAGDSVMVVGATGVAAVEVQVDGDAVSGMRYVLTSSDPSVILVRGDTLVAAGRGTAAVTLTLLSSVLPDSIPSVSRDVRVIVNDVSVTPASVTLISLGDTVRLEAEATDIDDQPITGLTFAWVSSDASVATVTAQGRVQAIANGTALIHAILDDDTTTTTVTVAQELVEYAFVPGSLFFDRLSDTSTVQATGRDGGGNAIAGATPSWVSRNTAVASVTAQGRVQAKGNGTTYVVATTAEVSDSLTVTVDQAAAQVVISTPQGVSIPAIGDELQLVAVGTDGGGSQVQDDPVSWSTLNSAVAAVSTLGRVTGLGVGTAQIVASLDAAADTIVVTVSNDPIAMEVTPTDATLASVGDTVFMAATARNVRDDVVSGLTFSWRTPDTSVTVNSSGRVIAVSRGTARVIGGVNSIADTAIITVTNAPATVTIDTSFVNLTSLGDSVTLPATIQNARGADLPRNDVVWESDNELIARVTPRGIVIARDTGETIVHATSGALTDQVSVQVFNVPDSLWLDSDLDTLTALGQQLPYHAEVWNARRNPIPDYPIQWETTNESSVVVADSGWITAVGSGSAYIRGRAGPVVDSIAVVVTDPTVYYVDNSTVVEPRFGSLKRPYQHIQDAVEAADARDTVYVFFGTGRYSESVALSRQITLMGDTTKWMRSNFDQDSLTRIYHDTGWAAISAYTSAPVRIERLSILHTLDGPAVDVDGSTLNMKEVYVNYYSSVPFDNPVGRGISIRNAPAGTEIAHTTVRAVNGYGIYLENTSEVLLIADHTRFIDSIPGEYPGAGVQIRGGGNIRIQALEAYTNHGPHILADSTSELDIVVGEFYGCGMHMHLRNVTHAFGGNNNHDLRCYYEDGEPNAWTPAMYFQNSTNVHFGRDTVIDQVEYAFKIGYWWEDSGGGLGETYFFGGMENIRATRSHLNLSSLVSDSAGSVFSTGVVTSGDWQREYSVGDSINIENSSFSNSGGCVNIASLISNLRMNNVSFTNCNTYGGTVLSWYSDAASKPILNTLTVTNSTFTGTGLWGVSFRGQHAELRRNVFTQMLPGSEPGLYGGPVVQLEADTMEVTGNVITDNAEQMGLLLASSQSGLVPLDQEHYVVDSNLVARNAVGVESWLFDSGNPVFSGNDIYDNDTLGLRDNLDGLTDISGNWWGDGRGPLRDAVPAATGDSVQSTFAVIDPVSTAPVFGGAVATGIRAIRGDGQSATAGTQLIYAFTVRVIDDEGKPVSGQTVTFTVTGGGGTIDDGVTSGATTLDVTSDASGLAEVTLTTGASAGTNTVTTTAAGQAVTFTATGT